MSDVKASGRVDAALERGIEGHGASRGDAMSLLEDCSSADLLGVAAAVRDRSKGRVVSYSRKVFIPLTHLCRDYCGYCTFRADPQAGVQPYMTPEQVLEVADAGYRAGCKEALFSLGDQPELVFPEAKAFLKKLGFERTLEYLAAMSRLVLEETGLLPHSNPGVMRTYDLERLRESNISVGLMLESASMRLTRPEGAHWKAPDKVPSIRLRTLEEAGQLSMAFTTGILIGIGETLEERVDALLAIRAVHKKYGHIQEIIIQPFRAKHGTRMTLSPEPSTDDLQRTIAVARLLFGEEMNIQSPPNLLSDDYPELLKAGINDWGGVSPVTKDFINPEATWPQISSLRTRSAASGLFAGAWRGIFPWLLPILVTAAFTQYYIDSHWGRPKTGLRRSNLGRYNGILYFVPPCGDFLIRLGLHFLQPVLTLLVWGLVASTLISMGQRFWFGRTAAKPVS